jgi:hypothetical protein
VRGETHSTLKHLRDRADSTTRASLREGEEIGPRAGAIAWITPSTTRRKLAASDLGGSGRRCINPPRVRAHCHALTVRVPNGVREGEGSQA